MSSIAEAVRFDGVHLEQVHCLLLVTSDSGRFKHFMWQYFLHTTLHLVDGVIGVIAVSQDKQLLGLVN